MTEQQVIVLNVNELNSPKKKKKKKRGTDRQTHTEWLNRLK